MKKNIKLIYKIKEEDYTLGHYIIEVMELLGRDYFPYVSELLRIESDKSKEEWHKIQIDFLKGHKYYTESARKLFDNNKREHNDGRNTQRRRNKKIHRHGTFHRCHCAPAT